MWLMTPRITISKNKDRELEIWLNEAGRDLLVKELNALSERNDHFHLSPSSSPLDVPIRTIPYRDTDEVFEWGKVLFRPDQWDARVFPHVLDEPVES
jgi:hypothetical protein